MAKKITKKPKTNKKSRKVIKVHSSISIAMQTNSGVDNLNAVAGSSEQASNDISAASHSVYWNEIIRDLLLTGYYRVLDIAQNTGASSEVLFALLERNDASKLNFRIGAKLLALHHTYFPQWYSNKISE